MDRHLNLFYSYNNNQELIENNLTRAFIHAFRFQSATTQKVIVETIIGESLRGEDYEFTCALQGNIPYSLETIRAVGKKYPISLVDASYITNSQKYRDQAEYAAVAPGRLPDGWIIEKKGRLILLIEAKPPQTEMDMSQLIAYAKHFFGYQDAGEYYEYYRNFPWAKALVVFQEIQQPSSNAKAFSGIAKDFVEFMKMFNVRPETELRIEDAPVLPQMLFPKETTISLSPFTSFVELNFGAINE
jgi:hypothetical protein